ncbi:hypothetical protein N3K66_004943 [Trichothecium roseum]|uniref:Uncharacterized protein n=1 Tax=Trichothecium roseum TaxID=47278 RepID=A0ACC0V5E4_9HYPO|nr:hypothetical protein N3K66_004943 [Trichothecium roseum]
MPPTIHLVRHAQGHHNVSVANEAMRDPDVTELGREQCARLRASFPHHARLSGLASSPLRRTVQTCLEAFGPLSPSTTPTSSNPSDPSSTEEEEERKRRLLPIKLIDVLQEISSAPCDTGSAPEALTAEFGPGVVDAGAGVRQGWTDKTSGGSPFAPTLAKLVARGREARRALRDFVAQDKDGDGHYAVTSHGGFLHFLTDDWHGIPSGSATGWKNCEWRSYQFVNPAGDDEEARLAETPESWRRRHGDAAPPSEAEMRELRALAHRELAPILKYQP